MERIIRRWSLEEVLNDKINRDWDRKLFICEDLWLRTYFQCSISAADRERERFIPFRVVSFTRKWRFRDEFVHVYNLDATICLFYKMNITSILRVLLTINKSTWKVLTSKVSLNTSKVAVQRKLFWWREPESVVAPEFPIFDQLELVFTPSSTSIISPSQQMYSHWHILISIQSPSLTLLALCFLETPSQQLFITFAA